jgi:phospholipase D1/2
MIMSWQNKTLKSLVEKVEKLGVKVGDYVRVLGLRTHGVNGGNEPKTEIVYVHSKMMLVDDRMAIVGSANINDRSLLGDRDSEVAVVTFGQDLVHANMNGTQVMVSSKIKKFRTKLWKEHF